jgi:hypothetical protein
MKDVAKPVLGKFLSFAVMCVCFATLGLMPEWTHCQGSRKVIVDGFCTILENSTEREARENAFSDACAKAVAEVVGITIHNETIHSQAENENGKAEQNRYLDVFSSITHSAVSGKVTSYSILLDSIECFQVSQGTAFRRVHLKLEAMVTEEFGESDPEFVVRVHLNQESFKNGDEIIISVLATKDCYVTVFCLTGSTVVQLLPNDILPQLHIAASKSFEFPGASMRKTGIHLMAGLRQGDRVGHESVFVVATKKKRPFIGWKQLSSNDSQDSLMSSTIGELNRWLCAIPLDSRTEDHVSYDIRE